MSMDEQKDEKKVDKRLGVGACVIITRVQVLNTITMVTSHVPRPRNRVESIFPEVDYHEI